MSVTICQSTWHYITEHSNLQTSNLQISAICVRHKTPTYVYKVITIIIEELFTSVGENSSLRVQAGTVATMTNGTAFIQSWHQTAK